MDFFKKLWNWVNGNGFVVNGGAVAGKPVRDPVVFGASLPEPSVPYPSVVINKQTVAYDKSWVWTEDEFTAYIAPVLTMADKRKFYNGIKRDGISPDVSMPELLEYRYWNKRGLDYATAWVAKYDTPAPRPHHGV